MSNRRTFVKQTLMTAGALATGIGQGFGQKAEIKIGLIGLDTSHAPVFTRLIHDTANPLMTGLRVTGAYPYGSTRIESSASRIPQFTKEVEAMGVQIHKSIDSLIGSSDVIMLLTNDGALHYEQIIPVLKARNRVFIDKPIGANLKEVRKIINAVNQYQVPMFSSSALRYLDGVQQVRYNGAVGDVLGAEGYSPQKFEPSHTDLYWYGIHGVEILYTMMGPGCEAVKRITGTKQDMVVGRWRDGRIGTYKGDVETRQFYGGVAYGTKGVLAVGPFKGYGALTDQIASFFKTGKSPVDEAETVELYTFMEAADESKRRNGDWVELKNVFDAASE